ncbi:MAG: hypothetical protein IMF26_00325 [Candidatus Fermentithermobacillus carboniphilus]|uniref:histidine kinase n=1 Tax=Candidatus Fermentithermobacillus carboniphilus TaxID=3085328 RepID=A0AAT9LBS9_9FIRM|nr:MAG: hypothetical protein IMF26_00325 [Candidatus Fermentithermobacillus carboniphilus]
MRLYQFIHSVKNHLATMSLLIKMIEPGLKETPYQRHLSLLRNEVSHIQEMICSLVSPERAELAVFSDILKELCEEFAPRMEVSHVRVLMELEEDVPPVACNPSAISDAFANVWGNALDAMANGGTLWIRLYRDPTACAVKVSFTDTGPGIPGDIISSVSSPFFTTKPGGLGLGLTIAEAVAKAHGGSMDILSGPDGTTVTFTFPQRPSQEKLVSS